MLAKKHLVLNEQEQQSEQIKPKRGRKPKASQEVKPEAKKEATKKTPKSIETEGEPKGANPICVPEKARLTAFSGKLAECKTLFQSLAKTEQDIIEAENQYIKQYYDLGQKIHEAKQIYHAENNKKLSDQAFTDLFNQTYASKGLTISRALVQRAKQLVDLWQQLDRTQKICLIRGENWVDALKYSRNKLQEPEGQDDAENTSGSVRLKTEDDGKVSIAGMDVWEIFSRSIEKLQKDKAKLPDILDVFLSSLTSDEGKFTLQQVESEFKKAYQRLAD